MVDQHLTLPRGFHDVEPTRMAALLDLRAQWFHTCGLFGYRAIEVPPVGFASTFNRGHHASGERVYQFEDRRGRPLALNSDSLPAALRFASTRALSVQRLSYCCPVFRYERRPRRHFHHLGLMEVDRRPSASHRNSALVRLGEVVSSFLANRLAFSITITAPGVWHDIVEQFTPPSGRTSFVNALRYIAPEMRAAHLRQHGAPEYAVRLVESVAAQPGQLTEPLLGGLPGKLSDRLKAVRTVAAGVGATGATVRVDLMAVHASEFHDGIAMMFKTAPSNTTLGDGGSYGLFAQAFLTENAVVTSAVLGLERLADLTAENHPPVRAADVAVLCVSDSQALRSVAVATNLREHGIAVWQDSHDGPLSRQLRDLEKLAIPFSILIGDRDTGSTLRVRTIDGTMHSVDQGNLADWLCGRLPTIQPGAGSSDHTPAIPRQAHPTSRNEANHAG